MSRCPLNFIPILATLLLAGCGYTGLFQAPVELDEQFQAAAKYEFGQSRVPLTTVEEQVRTVDPVSADADRLREQLGGLLASDDATLDAKRFALRNLALIGQREDVAVIAPLLLDDDLSDMARYALQPMNEPAVDQALRKALSKASASQKTGIINTLGRRGDKNSLWAISRQLDSEDAGVQRAAVIALGEIGGSRALRTLRAQMGNAPDSLRAVYTEACLAAADSLVDTADAGEAIEAYRGLMGGGQPDQIRIAAFRGMVMASGADAGSVIIEEIQGNDPALKQMALVMAREVPGAKFTEAVAGQMDAIEPELQVTLLQILGERGDGAALPQVAKAVSSPVDEVRLEALQALGMIGDETTVALLAQAAADASGVEQTAARNSLNRLNGPGIDKAIEAGLLGIPAGEVALRGEYIRALGSRQAIDSAPTLLKLAADSQAKVREEAYKALAMMAGKDAVPGLVELIKGLDGETDRKAAEAALVAAATRSAQDTPAQAGFIIGRMSGASADTNASLLRVLGSIGDSAALPVIGKALDSGDKTQVDAAVRALADWPTPEPAAQLIKIAATSNEQTHQVLALRGYLRMAGLTVAKSPEQALAMYRQAINVASRPDEKKLILGGLGAVNDPAGFGLIKSMIDDPALSEEALAAQVKLANQLAIAAPDAARQAANEALAATGSDTLKQQARGVLALVERFDDYIGAWQAAGPYTASGVGQNDQLGHAFAPESDPAGVEWKTLAPSMAADKWMVDLKALYGVDNHAAYLRTNVWSPANQKVRAELGSDDGVKVWLNGEAVFVNNAARGLEPASDKVDLELKEGWNTLMLKISNGSGDWAAALRLRNLQGGHLEGLKIQTER